MKTRVFSYFDKETYGYMIETKANLIRDGFNQSSCSMLIRLAMDELRKNNQYDDIKEKLQERKMI